MQKTSINGSYNKAGSFGSLSSVFCSEICSILCLVACSGCLFGTKWIKSMHCLQKWITNADFAQSNKWWCHLMPGRWNDTACHPFVAKAIANTAKGPVIPFTEKYFRNPALPQLHISELRSMKQVSSVSKMALQKVQMSPLFVVLGLH